MILVCGEALIDLFVKPGVSDGLMLQAVTGGSPLNLAVDLARLAIPVAFFSVLSVDYFGTLLTDSLRKEGVDTAAPVGHRFDLRRAGRV